MSTERQIAVRLFINDKFNTTFGKGLFRRAIYNGTIELKDPNTKFLVDLYRYEEWEAKAKSDIQMEIIRKIAGTDIATTEGLLFSWIVHYDTDTKAKSATKGFLVYSPETNELAVNIDSPTFNTVEEWELRAHHCKATGSKIPAVIASNMDLSIW